ncbi:hypothetical protein C8R45DRAFT_989640 [Mycena sanguinolenta]|nr:hypothetical protein C8R45DRAFT_989640 [Mycena sanguinolenta]
MPLCICIRWSRCASFPSCVFFFVSSVSLPELVLYFAGVRSLESASPSRVALPRSVHEPTGTSPPHTSPRYRPRFGGARFR